MNRLIIIGNGFDLAHNLPTKYSDFLKWYWSKLNLIQRNNYGFYTYKDKMMELQLYQPVDGVDSYNSLLKYFGYYNMQHQKNYIFLNSFFLELNDNPLLNWVDIEMFYKEKLKNSFNSKHTKHDDILKLNREFADVRELFHNYLKEVISPLESKNDQVPGMHDLLQKWKEGKNYSMLFKDNIPNHLTKIKGFYNGPILDFNIEQKYILCFNYTNTIFQYISQKSSSITNFIHGHYEQENHPIVFGYGDESDELFPMLEEDNKNEYLEFTKSVSYSRTMNYNNLMNFIESDNFIVEIMGHSLAISDRTLLKTIFENEKCQYIFMYYHERDNGDTDFFDKSLNISRHFTDKKMMRKKVAPQVFCCPLPQKQK